MTNYQHQHGIKVLSLFDGIGIGYLALKNLGVKVAEYHAYEIDRTAIGIATFNHPDIVEHGDVTAINFEDYIGFDLLLCGFPCQDLSRYNNDRKGLDGEHSSLFWYGAEAVRRCRPTYWFFENVQNIPLRDLDTINSVLGVSPLAVCSSIWSAQTRARYYWTNIPVYIPNQHGPKAQTILESGIAPRDTYTAVMTHSGSNAGMLDRMAKQRIMQFKAIPNENGAYLHGETCWPYAQRYYNLEMGRRYDIERLTAIEFERLQTMPDDYTKYKLFWANNEPIVAEVGYHARHKAIGNSWTVKAIEQMLMYVWMDWNYPDPEYRWSRNK